MSKHYSLLALMLASAVNASATFIPVPLSGFNQDVVANGVGNASASTTAAVDLSNFDFVAPDFKAVVSDPAPTAALPANGIINSLVTPGLTFQLAPYTGNNSLTLTGTANGTLTFTTQYSGDLYVLGMSGNGPVTANITVTFADATTQVFNNVDFPDWYYQPNFAIKGIGRINRTNNVLEAPADDPRLYQPKLTLNPSNYGKMIASITVTKATSGGVLNIMGVSVCSVPVISSQPVNRDICQGDATTFATSASSASSYQWQVSSSTPANFTNVSNSATYSGATTATLTLTNTPASLNTNQYRCLITSACGGSATTAVRTLTVKPNISITSQTSSGTTCTKGAINLNVNHQGTATNYLWEMSTATSGFVPVPAQYPYTGVNSSQLGILVADDTLNNRIFRCSITGDCNTAVSADIPIVIFPAPYFAVPPQDDTVYKGDQVDMPVWVAGYNYEVYWQASDDGGISYVNLNDNGIYANTHTAILRVLYVQPAFDGKLFRCILKSVDPQCGLLRDTSDAARLTVLYPESVSTIAKESKLSLYPNPVSGDKLILRAGANFVEEVQATIIDRLGRIVYESEISFRQNKMIQVHVTLPSGLYYLKLNGNEVSETLSFIKE